MQFFWNLHLIGFFADSDIIDLRSQDRYDSFSIDPDMMILGTTLTH